MSNSSSNYGSFVPTTNIWDVSELESVEDISPKLKELMIRMYQNLNVMSLSLNTKDSGFYVTGEFVTGQVFFPNPAYSSATQQKAVMRQTYRKIINFGTLPNNTFKTMPHGLTPNSSFTFTRIYGCASDPVTFQYVPIPYASPIAAGQIELSVDATNVTITTAANWTAYTVTYVILEYMKS